MPLEVRACYDPT